MPPARRDARGRFVSGAGKASVSIIGMERLQQALAALNRLGQTEGYTAHVGTDLVDPPYPYFLEYGTSRMAARPSARPAFDEMKDTALAATGDYIGQMVAAQTYAPTILPTALKEGSRHIENRWKELAPYRTGTYKRSIHTEVTPGVEP
jgi:hypothetical protein